MESSANEAQIENTNTTDQNITSNEAQAQPEVTQPAETTATTESTESTQPAPLTEQFVNNTADAPEAEKSANWGKRGLIIGGAALAVVVGIGGFYLGSRSGQPQANANGAPEPTAKDRETSIAVSPSTAPTPEATATPEASANPETSTPKIEAGTDNDVMGRQVFEQVFVNWRNAGMSKTIREDQAKSGYDEDTYETNLANENSNIYESSLLSNDWQRRQDILTYVDDIEKENKESLWLNYQTAKDTTPFEWTPKYEKTIVSAAGTEQVDLTVFYYDINNADRNSAQVIDDALPKASNVRWRIDVKMLRDGNEMKISAISKIPAL